MAIVRLQGEKEKEIGIYYEFDPASKPLGEGGMGKVYRGKRVNIHTHETRDVAIKFMFSGLPDEVVDRARREANIIIHHDNLIEMMGFFTVNYMQAAGNTIPRYHVVSEFIQGVTLSDVLQGSINDQYGKPVVYAKKLYALYNNDPVNFAVTVMKKLLSGISALHDAGYIHRDIDPTNIMITTDGKIKLIDFGIAKRIDGLITHDKNLTTAGVFMGKPQYAAPELALGDIKSQNKETDIYALGIMMFQLIVGHLPFEGSTQQVLTQHIRGKMPLKDISDKKLRNIVRKATAKEPVQRFRSASEFRVALDNPESGLIPPIKIIIMAAVGVLLVAAIAVVVAMSQKEPVKPDTNDGPIIEVRSSIKDKLLNTNTAEEGYKELLQKVEKKDIQAMFLLSQLYTRPYRSLGLDPDVLTMQSNLKNVLKQNPGKAHSILLEITEIDKTCYPALYELARDYFVGPELTGGEPQNLPLAKKLLNIAAKHSNDVNDPVYNTKISGMLKMY